MVLRSEIEKKVLTIQKILSGRDYRFENYGLLSGSGGGALFLYHYEKFYGRKAEILTEDILNGILSAVEKHPGGVSYCAGVSGICYLFTLLRKENFIEIELGREIDDYIGRSIGQEAGNLNYEFLYGLTGIANYLLLEPSSHTGGLTDILNYLDASKEVVGEPKGYRWKSGRSQLPDEYNLSMSHGMASIAVLLSKMLSIPELDSVKVSDLLTGLIRYLFSQQIDHGVYGSYFSCCSDSNGPVLSKSRLGWCYGDLGMAMAIYQAGKATGNDDWMMMALEILRYAANHRRNLREGIVLDAGFCHGTSGIAQIFYRLWWDTGIGEFREATDFWIGETLSMARFEDGYAGYKALSNGRTWYVNSNLIEGIAGIGLVLLYYLQQEEPDWDNCFLLS